MVIVMSAMQRNLDEYCVINRVCFKVGEKKKISFPGIFLYTDFQLSMSFRIVEEDFKNQDQETLKPEKSYSWKTDSPCEFQKLY